MLLSSLEAQAIGWLILTVPGLSKVISDQTKFLGCGQWNVYNALISLNYFHLHAPGVFIIMSESACRRWGGKDPTHGQADRENST